MSRFAKLYVTVFSVIWIGYGLFRIIQNKPAGLTVLLFGIAFSVVFFFATWFSQWVLWNYQKVDRQSKEIAAQLKN